MTNRLQFSLTIGLLTGLVACSDDDASGKTPETTTDTGEEIVEAVDPSSDCTRLGLPIRDFNPEDAMVPQRHAPAGDFTVPLVDGTEWTLSEQWSGCDSYVFLPHWLTIGSDGSQSWWEAGIDGLIEKSPPNAHYFFVVAGGTDDPTLADNLATNIAGVLAPLSIEDRTWWSRRLHVVAGPSTELEGLVQKMFQGAIGTYGMAIDRFQKLRTLGSMAAVEAYNPNLDWPWEYRIYEAGYQPEYYNFEAEREVRLESEDALVIEVMGDEVWGGNKEVTLAVPDNIDEYDTLEIDIVMECPNRNGFELGNCGAWDYLSYLWLWEEFDLVEEDTGERKDDHEEDDTTAGDTTAGDTTGGDTTAGDTTGGDTTAGDTTGGDTTAGDTTAGDTTAGDTTAGDSDGGESTGGTSDPIDTVDPDTGDSDTGDSDTGEAVEEPEEPAPPTGRWLEVARVITTYHREARWVIDASHALPWLQEGGERTVRFENSQSTNVTIRFRFSKRDKPAAPREVVDLFTGGGFNTAYNDREPIEVDIPSDAAKVEIVSLITGHGMAERNCAEFCEHSHHFTVNGTEFSEVFDQPGNQSGCAETVGEGTVPNQPGTWWYGRGGWCPGREVAPTVTDVTDQVTPGETATLTYHAKLQGGDLIDGAGNIRMSSWLLISK